MPATGLKIVGTGACLPWCSISSSFKNSLKTSGHQGYEFLKFWCWNLVPFLLDIGFQLLTSLWSSLMYFSVNNAPNVLYRWEIWTASRPIQHRTLLLRSHAVVIAAVCGFALSCWKTRPLEGSICCSKTFIYLSAFIVPSKTCKLPIPYALMHHHTIRDAGFWTECWWQPGGHGIHDFQQECQIWSRLTIDHFSTLKQSILNEPWPTGHDGVSGSHMASFLHDRALVGICRWHSGLCLTTVVSVSIPKPI